MTLANGLELDFREKSALQHESEISEMLNTIYAAGCEIKDTIEIGTFEGATALLWAQLAMRNSGKAIAVDVQFGTEYKAAPEWTNRCAPVYRGTEFEPYVIEVEGDSQLAETWAKVAELLGGKEVDFLFIDGDHNYELALADFFNYRQYVKKGGWIAFHDVMNPTWGVSRLWTDLVWKYPKSTWLFHLQSQPEEIQKTCRDKGFVNGIGLLRWGQE